MLFFASCEQKLQEENLNLGDKPFYVEVIANSDLDLAKTKHKDLILSVDGQDFNKNSIRSFKDNKVIFEGTYDLPESASIEYKYNVENYTSFRIRIPLLFEKDSVKISFNFGTYQQEVDVDEFHDVATFENTNVLNGKLNQLTREKQTKFYEMNGSYMWSWDIADSLNEVLYPKIRSQLLQFYEKDISNVEEEIVKVQILERLVHDYSFDKKEWLTADELNKLNLFYSELDTSLVDLVNYKRIDAKMNKLNGYSSSLVELMDFKVLDSDDKEGVLSSSFEERKINILYFWTSSCRPCHRFIQELKDEYRKYENNPDYHLVFVNMDRRIEDWEKVTNDYNIQWTNLYAGDINDIMYHYQFTGFPTKRAYNQNNKPIDFDFQIIDNLLKGNGKSDE